MSERPSIAKRVALILMSHVSHVLPPARSEWGKAMRHELDQIEGGWQSLRWSAGCVFASYLERTNERPSSVASVLKKPSAFLPIAMSFTALVIVFVSIAVFGVVHEHDEGATAHMWQLLMAGQMPVLLLFALKWLPRAPKQALCVLALQAGAVLAAMAPVYYLKL